MLASLSDRVEVDLDGPVEVSFKSDSGFAGGFYVGFRPSNTRLAIQIEALYTRRNSNIASSTRLASGAISSPQTSS